jgi:O-antigen/teichoic acid export membrane protein
VINLQAKQEDTIKGANMLKELLLFYIPLGLYSMIMMSTHSVKNFGVSRAHNPEIGLAAFAVTMNIMNMFASPCFTSRQMLVALAHDKKSLKVSRDIMLKITVFSLSMLAILSFTPVGEFVFVELFNTPVNLLGDVKTAAVYTMSLPFIYTLRSYAQGIIIIDKKTQYLTYTVMFRIAFMFLLAIVLPNIGSLSGATIGVMIWTAGMALEAVVNYLYSIKSFKNLPDEPNYDLGNQDLSAKYAFNFIWPLIITSFIWTLGIPMMNSGLGRTSNPELSLATFQVSRNFVWIIVGFLENSMRQVPLIYGTSEEKIDYLKKFTFGMGSILTLAVAILAFSPIGNWALLHIIGVSENIANASRPVLIVLIVLPFFIAWSEYYSGLLMRLNNTKSLSVGKIINLGLTVLSVISFSILMPQLGATVAALGLIIGNGAEILYFRIVYKKALVL